MQLPRIPHRWKLTPKEAVALQRVLANRISCVRESGPFRLIAGLDAAFSRDGRNAIAGVVLWDAQSREVVERHVARRRIHFPYIPGLLSFREAPALLAVLRRLRIPADLLMCDGQGLAHPRRLGIASHMGLVTKIPAIGCAKSRLVGTHEDPPLRRGDSVALWDQGEIIGRVLCTRDAVRPLYISIGHRIDLESACDLVLSTTAGFRLPEPTRLADRLVARAKQEEPANPRDSQ